MLTASTDCSHMVCTLRQLPIIKSCFEGIAIIFVIISDGYRKLTSSHMETFGQRTCLVE